jgi:recombination protein RecA
MYNSGIIRSGEIFDLAIEFKIIEQRGKNYQFGDRILGPGRSAVIDYIDCYPGFATALEQVIRQKTIE